MFQARKSNIVNFETDPDTTWKPNFPGSDVFSWTEKHKGVAVDLVFIGQLRNFTLASARSPFKDSPPAYRVELDLEQVSASALRELLGSGPLRDSDDARIPILGRTATFSTKLHTLNRVDCPTLGADDPFPYLWDGKGMARGDRLKKFSPSRLAPGTSLAVETNISTYAMSNRTGYTMSLRAAFVLEDPDPTRQSTTSTPSRKRQGDELISPRRNKAAGQRAVFSDDDD